METFYILYLLQLGLLVTATVQGDKCECTSQKDRGRGQYNSNYNCWIWPTIRWYFNIKTGKCEPFYYNGCFGNSNNYETKEDCEAKCSSITQCYVCPADNSQNCDSASCHGDSCNCPTSEHCCRVTCNGKTEDHCTTLAAATCRSGQGKFNKFFCTKECRPRRC